MGARTMSTPEDWRVRREEHHEADVVIVGAGIFGCAAAFALASQGRSVLLLERTMTEPDRIVGELLQPGGVASLWKLGLGHCVDGIDAQMAHGMNVIFRGEQSVITYPPLDDDGQIPYRWGGAAKEGKRPQGRSFHHGRFVSNLRRSCLEHPNITVVETEVTGTLKGEHSGQILGVKSRTGPDKNSKVDDYYFGQLTIIADGYNSKFRKDVIDHKVDTKGKFYALELHDCDLPVPGYGHVVIGDAFPVLLYKIGANETRALFDVPVGLPEASPAAGGVRNYLINHAAPSLPASIQPAVERALADGKIPRSMPNSWLPPTKQSPKGIILLGDAMNMRHPLTGGGMTVALNDVVILSELLHPSRVPDLGDPAALQAVMNEHYWRRKNVAGIVNVLAMALYSLFAADDRQLRALQAGCFEYFKRGTTDGPMGLLAGLLHQPIIMFYHFFYVAFLAIWMHAMSVIGGPLGIWKTPLALIDAVLILWKACVVFLPFLWRETVM